MADYKNMSDAELILLLKAGEKATVNEIYNRYWKALLTHAKGMLHDDQQAEDVVQDIFVYLLTNSEKLQLTGSLKSYLHQMARNKIIGLIRHEKVRINHLESLQYYFNNGIVYSDEMIRERELNQKIDKEIGNLPAKMRSVFELSRQTPMTYKEIAAHTNISEGTVRKQIYYALKILRVKLGKLNLF